MGRGRCLADSGKAEISRRHLARLNTPQQQTINHKLTNVYRLMTIHLSLFPIIPILEKKLLPQNLPLFASPAPSLKKKARCFARSAVKK